MLHFIAYVLAASFFGPASLPNTDVRVAPYYCALPDGGLTIATVTIIDDLRITAKHALCSSERPDFVGPEGSDLAIIKSGPAPASCKDAAPGEPVVYAGYPGTTQDGKMYGYVARSPELDTGIALLSGVDVTSCGEPGQPCVAVRGLAVGVSTYIRPGYSGGPVLSAKDGRLVGIVSAVDDTGAATYFIPVSEICSALEEP